VLALPELRLATSADVPAMLEVFFHAVEDLDVRRGRTPQPRRAAPLEMHFEHLLETDPGSAYVAEDHARTVAFGVVMRRDAAAFLSFLFVEPERQSRRLGRAVLEACLLGAGEGITAVATCAEADQPVSTGLYASTGLAPRLPLYLLSGTPRGDVLPELPAGVERRRLSGSALAELDRAVVGYERPADHAWWAANRDGILYVDASGAPIGYGYAHGSGRVGPVAALDPAHLAAFVGDRIRGVAVLEGRQLIVPGHAITVLGPLLAAGMRIEATPAVYCSSGGGPRFDRYLPMSFALI
jgi:GNAT superfamily N-acetyltransferase